MFQSVIASTLIYEMVRFPMSEYEIERFEKCHLRLARGALTGIASGKIVDGNCKPFKATPSV